MADHRFSATTNVDGDEAVVTVVGDLDLATVDALVVALDEAFAAEDAVERVVVDLAGVEFVDSSGLTALIKAHRRGGEAGTDVVLRAPTQRVRRTLALTQLDSVLTVE